MSSLHKYLNIILISRTDRQKEGIRKWIKSKGIGLWCYCTGFGKTYSAVMLIKSFLKNNPEGRILISVPTEVLKQQWNESLVKFGIYFNSKVEIINTIVKNEWDVDLLIIDEIHGTPTNTFKQIFNNVNYGYLLGLTGTLERLDGKESYIKKYCPVIDKITIEEAIENKWLSPYKEYKVLIDVDLTEYNEISRKFNLYFAYFNYDFNLAMKCATNVIFRNSYAKKFGLNHKEIAAMSMDWMRCMRLRKDFVTSHPKKLEIANKILEKRQDKKCITFSATIKDAEKIKYGKTLHSKQSKKKNKITLDEFNTQLWGVLNTSKAADVGVDIPGLSVGIILSGDSSSIKKNQRRGRIIRYEDGKQAEMFTLVIRKTMEESWYNNASNSSYITINEEQLNDVLENKEIQTRQQNNVKNITYRF